jgi:hypothetical protein
VYNILDSSLFTDDDKYSMFTGTNMFSSHYINEWEESCDPLITFPNHGIEKQTHLWHGIYEY